MSKIIHATSADGVDLGEKETTKSYTAQIIRGDTKSNKLEQHRKIGDGEDSGPESIGLLQVTPGNKSLGNDWLLSLSIETLGYYNVEFCYNTGTYNIDRL